MTTPQEAQVSLQALQNAVNRIETAANNIRSQQSALESNAYGLARNWEGLAAGKFFGVVTSWHNRVDDILRSLERLTQSIHDSHKNYAEFNAQREDDVNALDRLVNADVNQNVTNGMNNAGVTPNSLSGINR